MYERCLNETERLLATSKEIVLPIKEVWKVLAAEGKRHSFEVPALTDFDALLEGDKRFEILSSQTEPDELESEVPEEGEEVDANLGRLGFCAADCVKLRRVALPGTALGGSARGKILEEEDEEVVPLNVKGLSTTRPVHPLERNKSAEKKTSSKAPVTPTSKKRSKAKKKSHKGTSTRKLVRKNLRRTR